MRVKARFRRLVIVAAILCGVVVMTGCIYNVTASRRLKRELAETPRVEATGRVIGINPIDLNPSGRRAVLLLHGFVGTPLDFGELPQALADAGYRVVAPILPGHGTRPTKLNNVTVADMDQQVLAVYKQLREQCDAVAVVGFSMGGALALRLLPHTTACPPDAVVLASPSFGVTYRWYGLLRPETWSRLLAPVVPYVIKGQTFIMVNRRDALSDLYAYDVVPTRAIVMLNTLSAEAREIEPVAGGPSLFLIYASDDGAASPARSRAMARQWQLPMSSQLILQRSNHHVFHDHERELVVRQTVNWIEPSLAQPVEAAQ